MVFCSSLPRSRAQLIVSETRRGENTKGLGAKGVAQRNLKIVGVQHRPLDLLARGKCYDRSGVTTRWIKHSRLEIDRRILLSDTSKITRWGMTVLAAACSIEIRLSGIRIAGQQFLNRIGPGDVGRM